MAVKRRRLPAETKGKFDLTKYVAPEIAMADAISANKGTLISNWKTKKPSWLGRRKGSAKKIGGKLKEGAKSTPSWAWGKTKSAPSWALGKGKAWLNETAEQSSAKWKRRKGVAAKIITLVTITLLIGYTLFILFFTQGGASTFAGLGEIGTKLKDVSRGSTAEINIVRDVLVGDYSFANTWRSDVQQTKYEGQEVGVKLENIRPIKDELFSGDTVIVTGTLKMIGLPASAYGTTPDFSADITAVLGTTGLSGIKERPGECTPTSIVKQRQFFDRFSCEFNNITTASTSESKEIKVNVNFDFEAISGKTIYALRNDAFEKLLLEERDPFKEYELKKQLSWQTPSDIGIGMGLQGESDIFPTNNNENTINHFLGVTIENKGSGKLNSVEEIWLIIPNNLEVNLEKSDFSFTHNCNKELNTCDYNLANPKFSDIEPGEKKTYFLAFKYNENALGAGDFKEVFILADIKYNYTLTRLTSVIVHKQP